MSRTLRVQPEAEAELLAAAEWYESKVTGLGDDLVAHFDRAIEQLLVTPEAGPLWRVGFPFRQCIIRRFPYVVFYAVRETSIEVIAFAHTKRRPGYWMKRSR